MNKDLYPMLIGKRMYLRGLEKKDLEGNWFRWFNDQDSTKFTRHGIFPNTYEKQVSFFESLSKRTDEITLGMADIETDFHFGVISLQKIDWINRNAEIALIVGEKEYQKSGYGLEAMCLMIDHGFKRVNLHKIYAGQDVGLEKWRKTLEKIGAKVEGFRKEHVLHDGVYHDVVMLGFFAQDFYNSDVTKRYI